MISLECLHSLEGTNFFHSRLCKVVYAITNPEDRPAKHIAPNAEYFT